MLGIEAAPTEAGPSREIRYRHWEKRSDGAVNEHGLRFEETVPVETIRVTDPAIKTIPEAEREVITEFSGCHNIRSLDTIEQMRDAADRVIGKRLMYWELIGSLRSRIVKNKIMLS